MTPLFRFDPERARQAFLETLPQATSQHGAAPDLRFTYVPASHSKALHPDTQLVVGMRGAGKSFWWAALQQEAHRKLLRHELGRLRALESARIAVGFGEQPNPDHYPDADTFRSLLDAGIEPRLIWRTVILNALSEETGRAIPSTGWREKVAHVRSNPEAMARLLAERDEALDRNEQYWIILFDALDRSAHDWPALNKLVRGLLQAILELRPYRRLRAKCFLRTDQLDEQEVASFPDASKLMAERVELEWPSRELWGLLFQHLGNAQESVFREGVASLLGEGHGAYQEEGVQVWIPFSALCREEATQTAVVHALAGEWMGRDRRRGRPYTWVPSHLADAAGKTSPRPFLAALRQAAEDTRARYPDHRYALHYESIKRGVQEASKIRVRELKEDYPWVDDLMRPLAGIVVPCEFDRIASMWEKRKVLEALRRKVEDQAVRLPPAHLDEGPEGVRRDLEELGIFLRMRDGRVNIPDVYRVGYGLGRKGGVRPVRAMGRR